MGEFSRLYKTLIVRLKICPSQFSHITCATNLVNTQLIRIILYLEDDTTITEWQYTLGGGGGALRLSKVLLMQLWIWNRSLRTVFHQLH